MEVWESEHQEKLRIADERDESVAFHKAATSNSVYTTHAMPSKSTSRGSTKSSGSSGAKKKKLKWRKDFVHIEIPTPGL